ncbi:MAG: LamG domain-containing protein [Proteobacteria bacterium]|nr:LamG domain-containing protein [Pseudomonadota bacterium]
MKAAALLCLLTACLSATAAESLTAWVPIPADWKGAVVTDTTATLTGDKWSSLRATKEFTDVQVAAIITIAEPAKTTRFFGQGWSAWPDATFSDGGFDAGVLLRAGTNSGYRVQLSHKYQIIAVVKWPEGGYVQVVPCAVKLKEPHKLVASAHGSTLKVSLDGVEKVNWQDRFLPLTSGAIGIGINDGAKAAFSEVSVGPPPRSPRPMPPHSPNFSVRPFLGGRQFVFDGDEPVLQLHYEKDPSVFAKLRPGYKPQLTFDSHWDLANQGAFKDADSKWTAPVTSGGGKSLKATWSARSVKHRFTTQSTLTVGFDAKRGTYTYDIESALEVLPGEPFYFRYGFDFEHHTPLDPFRWQYLVAKKSGGSLYHRPVYPIDPGPQYDLETAGGTRVWFGRHLEQMHIAPAVEYDISSGTSTGRKLNTAVCAAFYDTGVSFAPETPKPGTRLEVKYRYTGVPAAEAKSLFDESKVYDAPTLDPKHHYIFSDEWPKLTFSQFVPMSESWILGRTPFMTAHNTRPTYELEQNCGAGSGFAMKLGAASFGKANLAKAVPLAKGRYAVTAMVKADNLHGPGGRIELIASQAKTNKKLAEARHYIGNGTFAWRKQGFVLDVPEDAGVLEIAFGNAGTGDFLVTDVEFRKLADGESLPAGVLAQANDQPAAIPPAPAGAVADYRMLEGKGLVVLNHGSGGGLGHLDLANLDFVTDAGHPALRFADNLTGRKDYRLDSGLNRFYLSHPSYAGKDTLPLALTGHHGGGAPIPGLTLAAWIKPAPEMGKSGHGGKGDILGYGARRFVLGLHGGKAPYQLAARINVNDTVTSSATIAADRWYHVAMTAEPKDGQWLVRLYLDGQPVGEGLTKKFPADSLIVPSLILGAEIFYFHDAYYRGLIGRTLVMHRAVPAEEIAALAK